MQWVLAKGKNPCEREEQVGQQARRTAVTSLRDRGEAATRREGSRFTVEGRTGKGSGYSPKRSTVASEFPGVRAS